MPGLEHGTDLHYRGAGQVAGRQSHADGPGGGRVEEVINIAEADIEETPSFGGQICTDYIIGIAKVKNLVKTLLDIDGIVGADTLKSLNVLTDFAAPRQRIVAVDLGQPDRGHWREIVPEADDTLSDAYLCGGRLVCHYLHHASSRVRVHELDGAQVRDLPIPALTSVTGSARDHAGIEGRPAGNLVHFELESFTAPGSLWEHDLDTGETRLVHEPGVGPERGALTTEQVFATSPDGTAIPVFLSRRRDISPNGDVPVLLCGYGGFDVAVTPRFSARAAAWMERGGLFAVAVLRGGGEFGTQWHDAGRLANKQNVFDDFAACARWLTTLGLVAP